LRRKGLPFRGAEIYCILAVLDAFEGLLRRSDMRARVVGWSAPLLLGAVCGLLLAAKSQSTDDNPRANPLLVVITDLRLFGEALPLADLVPDDRMPLALQGPRFEDWVPAEAGAVVRGNALRSDGWEARTLQSDGPLPPNAAHTPFDDIDSKSITGDFLRPE
jgi:hypothetical protein